MRHLFLSLFALIAAFLPGSVNAQQLQTVEQLYGAVQHVERAKKYEQMNLWDEAEQEYWQAVGLDYNNVKARLGLGDVYRRKQMFEQAIENYFIHFGFG